MKDWVVNAGTWNVTGIDGGTYNPQGVLDAVGELAVFPLTMNKRDPANVTEVALPEIAHSMTGLMTMGYIHWHLEPPTSDSSLADMYVRSWRATIAMRITRWPQEPNGQTIGTLGSYDLTGQFAANDQFVWHYERHLVNQSSNDWLGTSGSKAPITGSVRVAVKYRRRIEENECMALVVQFLQGEQLVGDPWEDVAGVVGLNWQSHLRTFVSA